MAFSTKYVDKGTRDFGNEKLSIKRFTATFAVFFLALAFALSSQIMPSSSNSNSSGSGSVYPMSANAAGFGIFCGNENELGTGMQKKSSWDSMFKVYPEENANDRKWTLQESLGNGVKITGYYGEGEGGNGATSVPEDRAANAIKALGGTGDNVIDMDKAKSLRTVGNCTSNISNVSNEMFAIAGFFTSVSQSVTSFAFDGSLICDPDNNSESSCIDLVGLIGGTDEDEGLLQVLTDSIYFPLLVIVAMLVGIYIIVQAAFRGKIIEGFKNALWALVSIMIGLLFLMNPAATAKAPMVLMNEVGGCIMGTFTGVNCLTGDRTDSVIEVGDDTSDSICTAAAQGTAASLSMRVNTMSCFIWKAFVLEPFAQASFGYSYEDLDTTSSDSKAREVIDSDEALSAYIASQDDLCVYLSTSESLESYRGSELVFDGKTGDSKVCNLVAYHMFLSVNAHQSGDEKQAIANNSTSYDPRWYNLVAVTSHDDTMWQRWTSDSSSVSSQTGTAFVSMLTSGVGTIGILTIAVWALMYYITALLIIAFAPIAFLMAPHPGLGNRFFRGWVQSLLQNMIWYITSIAIMIIVVTIYGSVLSTVSNALLSIVFVIVITVAALMYRKELIDISGQVELGGVSLSNRLQDSIASRVRGVGSTTGRVAGGTIGATVADKSRIGQGLRSSLVREAASVGGVIGAGATEFQRQRSDANEDAQRIVDARAATISTDYERLEVNNENLNKANDMASNIMPTAEEAHTKDRIIANIDLRTQLHDELTTRLDKSGRNGQMYAEAKRLENSRELLEVELKQAKSSGDQQKVDSVMSRIKTNAANYDRILPMVKNKEKYDAMYQTEWARAVNANPKYNNLSPIENIIEDDEKSYLNNFNDKLGKSSQYIEDSERRLHKGAEIAYEIEIKKAIKEAHDDYLNGLGPSDVADHRKLDHIEDQVRKEAVVGGDKSVRFQRVIDEYYDNNSNENIKSQQAYSGKTIKDGRVQTEDTTFSEKRFDYVAYEEMRKDNAKYSRKAPPTKETVTVNRPSDPPTAKMKTPKGDTSTENLNFGESGSDSKENSSRFTAGKDGVKDENSPKDSGGPKPPKSSGAPNNGPAGNGHIPKPRNSEGDDGLPDLNDNDLG